MCIEEWLHTESGPAVTLLLRLLRHDVLCVSGVEEQGLSAVVGWCSVALAMHSDAQRAPTAACPSLRWARRLSFRLTS